METVDGRLSVWHVVVGAAGILLSARSLAADSLAETRRKIEPDILEEVVVTATKRAMDIQDVPQAITAITSKRLDELNALNVGDYFRDVPGLMLNTDDHGHLDFSIRGISDFSVSVPQTTATVAEYIDEIPVTSTGAQIDMRLVDIDRVEVLRGPQGTYYGEGALGGTVRIITQKPSLERFSANVEGRVSATDAGGSNGQASAMVNLPLVEDTFGLRANYFNASDSGYIDIVNTDSTGKTLGELRSDTNKVRSEGGRIVALFTPTSSVSILGEAIRTTTDTGQIGGYDPTTGEFLSPVVCPTPPPVLGALRRSRCYSSKLFERAELYNLTASVDLGWASVVSSSSWSDTRRNQANIPEMAGEQANPADDTRADAFTQELRLVSSPSWSQRWDYVFGAFDTRKHEVNFGRAVAGDVAVPVTYVNKETAFFAEGGYRFGDHWTARLGARTSTLWIDANLAQPQPDRTFVFSQVHDRFNPVTGRAVLDYAFNKDAMMYGSVSNGFRKGGVNYPSPFPQLTLPATYGPDKTVNYEVGWKLSFPARHATFNGALYHIDWKNMQAAGFSTAPGLPPVNYYRNAGDSKVDGLELESTVELLRGLMFQASFSYIDARLAEDYKYSENPLVLHGRKGDRTPFVAPVSGSLSLNYRRALGVRDWQAFSSVNGQYQGSRRSDFNPEFDDSLVPTYAVMKEYWLTGLQIGMENANWRTTLYVDNVLDTRAELLRIPTPLNPGHFMEVTTRPRTVGLTVRRRFN